MLKIEQNGMVIATGYQHGFGVAKKVLNMAYFPFWHLILLYHSFYHFVNYREDIEVKNVPLVEDIEPFEQKRIAPTEIIQQKALPKGCLP